MHTEESINEMVMIYPLELSGNDAKILAGILEKRITEAENILAEEKVERAALSNDTSMLNLMGGENNIFFKTVDKIIANITAQNDVWRRAIAVLDA